MKLQIARGALSVLFPIFCQDSTSTSGAGKTGLAFGDFSCRYVRAGETLSGAITAQDITTLGTYQAPTANTNIRIKKLDDTNMPGWYEVQIHNDWVNATGNCRTLGINLTASGMAPLPLEIQLTTFDMDVAMRGTDSAALASINTEARLAQLDTPMRGTDGAALASVCTETRIAELAAANLPAHVDTLITRLNTLVGRKTSIYTG